MIFHRLKLINKSQLGFTLIELMLAFTITAAIIGAITATIHQVVTGNLRSSNHMTAVRQVQDAGYWVSHDAQMAQSVVIGDDPATPEIEFLTLTWSDWGTNEAHQAVYTWEDMSGSGLKKLLRTHSYNSTNDTGIIAQFIDSDQTSCVPDDGALTFTVMAIVGTGSGQQVETRTYEVVPRASPQ